MVFSGLGECAWCVQNARCHPRDDPHGTCGSQVDSPSQIPGWWGAKGQEIRQPQDCANLDRRPGLTYIKYNHPPNFSQPDSVATLNATTIGMLLVGYFRITEHIRKLFWLLKFLCIKIQIYEHFSLRFGI